MDAVHIKHVMKDGSVLNDITGHLVRKEDVPCAYSLMEKLNSTKNKSLNKGEKE